MSLETLLEAVDAKSACLGVIGLGYVGIPVACEFARVGFTVVGVDIDPERVDAINHGRLPLHGEEPGLQELLVSALSTGFRATSDYESLRVARIILISVDTPVNADHTPNYTALRRACSSLGSVMAPGTLVIIESTVGPGTAMKVVRPLLEEASGLAPARDFFVGSCPERVMPGKLLHNLRHMSRVCGGETPQTADTVKALYSHVVQADLDVSDTVTAELVKTTENAYRDVQIAFANEVALICESTGADVWRVRELVNKSPHREMHRPGAGVGGHCIPKDPWLLASASSAHVVPNLIAAARKVNDSMPSHVANLVCRVLDVTRPQQDKRQVAILGYSYLEDSGDTRNSPSAALEHKLRELGMSVAIHDPWVHAYRGDVFERVVGSQVLVVMVAHREYLEMDLAALRSASGARILIDARGLFDVPIVESAGFEYVGVGRGRPAS